MIFRFQELFSSNADTNSANSNKRKLSQDVNVNDGDLDERAWQQPKSRQYNAQNQQQYSNYNRSNNNDNFQPQDINEQSDYQYRPNNHQYNNSYNRRGGGTGSGNWG